MASRYASFKPRTIRFLEQLKANNNREWFKENKTRYEDDVLDVALRFIISMQDPLAEIAPRFTAVPTRVGGSLMRVYRDTRFSKNKLPYKTNIGIQFRHEQAKDVHSPGYYVHIEPDNVFLGAGMWRPDPDSLRKIRERIAARPREWQRARGDKAFAGKFSHRRVVVPGGGAVHAVPVQGSWRQVLSVFLISLSNSAGSGRSDMCFESAV
jgi:uncharacterized protein (TIGR02453 family)